MKTVKKIVFLCAAFGWWGLIYPQFTLVKDTYEIVCEDSLTADSVAAAKKQTGGAEIYWEIMEADREQIRFKSRLLKEIKALQEQRRRIIHESDDQ